MIIPIAIAIVITVMISLFYYVMHLVKKSAIETEKRKDLEEARKDANKTAKNKIKRIGDSISAVRKRMRKFTRNK